MQIMLAEARTMEKIHAAELGGEPVALPDVTVHGGTRRSSPPAKGGGRAAKAEKDDTEAIALERLNAEQKVDDMILDRQLRAGQFIGHSVTPAHGPRAASRGYTPAVSIGE